MTTRARVQALAEGVSVKLPDNHEYYTLKRAIETQTLVVPLLVEYQRARYLEMLRVGFTKDEAIALCK